MNCTKYLFLSWFFFSFWNAFQAFIQWKYMDIFLLITYIHFCFSHIHTQFHSTSCRLKKRECLIVMYRSIEIFHKNQNYISLSKTKKYFTFYDIFLKYIFICKRHSPYMRHRFMSILRTYAIIPFFGTQ